MIKPNEGKTDRIIRIIVGIGIITYSSLYLQDNIKTIISILGIMILATGLVGWCGLYTLLGINTCPVKVKSKKK